MAIDPARHARRIESAYLRDLRGGDGLSVTVDKRPGAVVVRLAGALDAAGAAVLARALRRLRAPRPLLVLDLAGVREVDAAGLAQLLSAHRRATAAGVRLVLASPGPSVREAFLAAGADGVLTFAGDADAVAPRRAPML